MVPNRRTFPTVPCTNMLVFVLCLYISEAFIYSTDNVATTGIIKRKLVHSLLSGASAAARFGAENDSINFRRDGHIRWMISSAGCSRSDFLSGAAGTLIGGMLVSSFKGGVANAACLPGDTSENCIGVYKVPIDDEILPYVESKDSLQRFAPDINWVPPVQASKPKNYAEARGMVESFQKRVSELNEKVLKGDLVDVGKEVLDITPKLNIAGGVLLEELSNTGGENGQSMTAYKVEVTLEELIGKLSELDIVIGQGIRGDLGVITVAQLSILEILKEANETLIDLNRFLP